MRLAIALSALALAACNATMPQQQARRPTAADDPSAMCFRTIQDNPKLAVLKSKIPIDNPRSATLDMLSSTEKPTEEERAALRVWVEHRAACADSGRSFRAQYAPPGWALAFDQGQLELVRAISGLYGGTMTYGQFNAERQQIAMRTSVALDAAARQSQRDAVAAQAANEAAQQRANAEMLQTMQLMQAMQPRTVMPPPISPSVTCISRPGVAGTSTTTCN